jgi:hypothetical protein
MRGVREENGTLTRVKQVRCKRLVNRRKKNSIAPSKGGTQNRRIKDSAKGRFQNRR